MPSGGKRQGAGRPQKAGVPFRVRLPQEDIDLIVRTAEDLGISYGDVLSEMIRHCKAAADGDIL